MNDAMQPGFTEAPSVLARSLDPSVAAPVPYRPEQIFSDPGYLTTRAATAG